MSRLQQLAKGLGVRSDTRFAGGEQLAALTQLQPEANSHEEAAEAGQPMSASECRTQVTFLPRDPQWAYVFWSISSADRERAEAAGAQQLCLRVADVTGLLPGAAHPHTLQELVVQAGATEWFLPVPLCDR